MPGETATPEVLWAQRSSKSDADKNFVYLTIAVPDVPKDKLKLDLQPSKLTFTGTSNSQKKTYHVELDFYAEVDVAESKTHHTPRDIEFKLIKKELNEEYWPRLLKESKKYHFLKTDFDKWVDEDEQNEAAEEEFSNFGGGAGMGGMPGMGGADFGGIDFSKLGGGAGMPMPDGDEDDFEVDEEEDEDMPALEGEDEAKGAEAAEKHAK